MRFARGMEYLINTSAFFALYHVKISFIDDAILITILFRVSMC